MKSLICSKMSGDGGGGSMKMYDREFAVSHLDNLVVGYSVEFDGEKSKLVLMQFKDLLPVSSSFPLRNINEVRNYFLEEVARTEEDLQFYRRCKIDSDYSRCLLDRANHRLDAYDRGLRLLKQYVQR